MMSRTTPRGQHDEVPRTEVWRGGFRGVELFGSTGRSRSSPGAAGRSARRWPAGSASGTALLIVDRNVDAAEATAAALRAVGADAYAVEADVTSEEDAERAVQAAVERWGAWTS